MLVIGLVTLGIVPAQAEHVLRWSSQGDAMTMDPHAQNEGQTLTFVAGFDKGYFRPATWRDRLHDYAVPALQFVVPLAVIGGVLAQAEPGSVALQDEADGPGFLWATFAGRRMVFSYNAMTAMIELRDGTVEGYPLRLFGHRSLQMDVVNFFGSLRREGRF